MSTEVFFNRTITCANCSVDFVFTAEEQRTYQARGYQHDPKRCGPCRDARRQASFDNPPVAAQREGWFSITCDDCGKADAVPFEPRNGRPVYCRSCHITRRANQCSS